jgi:hypothetical protein
MQTQEVQKPITDLANQTTTTTNAAASAAAATATTATTTTNNNNHHHNKIVIIHYLFNGSRAYSTAQTKLYSKRGKKKHTQTKNNVRQLVPFR